MRFGHFSERPHYSPIPHHCALSVSSSCPTEKARMQNIYIMFVRSEIYYCEDRTTGQQKSLRTRDEAEAQRIIQAKNDAVKLPQMNLVMAKTYLSAQDPKMIIRTWAHVLERFCNRSNDNTRKRHERVARTKPMQFLKCKRLIETTADDFFEALKLGSTSTIAFLQTIHNDALGMGLIPPPRLPRKLWPKMNRKIKRAITEYEHVHLLAAVDDE